MRSKVFKVFIFIIFLGILISILGCLDKTGMEYLKIKYMLEGLFSSYHEEDIEGYMDYWSLFSPYREEEKQRAINFFASLPYFKDMLFGYYVDKFYYYEEGRALLEFTYIIGENIRDKGTMILKKEGNDWKVWKIEW